MKKFVLMAVMAMTLGSASGQGVKFFTGSFEEAKIAAATENKRIFLDFSTSWCVYCRKMAKDVFPTAEVGDYFNRMFITMNIDAESATGKPLALRYAVAAYPTFVIVDTAGEEITSAEGGMTTEQLLKWVRTEMGDTKTFEQLYEEYRKNPADDGLTRAMLKEAPDFLGRLPEGYQYDRWLLRVERAYADYHKRKPIAEWMNPEDFKILATYHTEAKEEDPIFEYVAANYGDIISKVATEEVDMFLFSLNMQLTQQLAEKGDMDYEKCLERIKGDLKPAYDNMLTTGEMDSYTCMKYLSDAAYTIYNRKDVAQYTLLMDEYLKNLGDGAVAGDYSSAIQVMYDALNGNLTAEASRKGVEWITKALQYEGINAAERMELLIMNGDCYKMLADKENATQCYKQAYALSLQFENPNLSAMIQQMMENL